MSMVLYDCGHFIRDADVLNFLKFTMKELHHIQYVWTKHVKFTWNLNWKLKINLQVVGWKIAEACNWFYSGHLRTTKYMSNSTTIRFRTGYKIGILGMLTSTFPFSWFIKSNIFSHEFLPVDREHRRCWRYRSYQFTVWTD